MRQLSRSTHEWRASDREELLQKARNGEVVVIDVRPPGEYAVAHLPYARSMPLAELKVRLAELPKDKPIVAYCRGPFCLISADAVALLRSQGFEALQLRDGMAEWGIKVEQPSSSAIRESY